MSNNRDNRVLPDIVNGTTQEEQILLPYVGQGTPVTVNSAMRMVNKETDIKTKKSSFRLDLQPIINDNQLQTKLSPDSKNILSLLNGSTPIHLSPAADLEKLLPSGGILLTGTTPTTPPGVSFLLSNEVNEESEKFADCFTSVYSNLLQQENQKEEPGNGSHLIDISQSIVQPAGNNQASTSRFYIIAPQQIPQEGLSSIATHCVSVPQTVPTITSAPPVPHPPNGNSVLTNVSTVSQPLNVSDFQTSGVANNNSRRPPSGLAPSVSPSLNDPRSCQMRSSPSIDSKLSDVESTNSSADTGVNDMTKLERKRARNRDAARRCRDRKMHKIVSLEQKVKQLNDENRRLKSKQVEQREQLVRLKAIALEHFKKGCRFEFDMNRVDAVLSSPLKKEPDSAAFDDGAL